MSENSPMTARKHLYLLVSHPNDAFVGNVVVRDKRYETATKNEERVIDKRNVETGESYAERVVGLGYCDFEDDDDYEERFTEVVQEKLAEIDPEYLEEAGLDPEEATA